ncbi:MAG: hypothetical protein HY063_01305 [Bacteroidetes bacterium]|nr:hypothetical protein [Bacteroidota bacterium]
MALCFLSSCFSIEKRKYMNGYHVEWLSKKNNNLPLRKITESVTSCGQSARRIQREPQKETDSVFSAETSAFSAVNNSSEKNILVEKRKIQIIPTACLSDTLPEKTKNKNNLPSKFDERKDVTKKESNYILGKLGFYFGFTCWIIFLIGRFFVIPYMNPPFFLIEIMALSSISIALVGLIFSVIAMKNNKEGKKDAIAGLVFNLFYLLVYLTLIFIYLRSVP